MRPIIGLALAAGAFCVSAPAFAATASCDRTCLIGISEQYLAAFVAHDPSKAPLAPNVRYTEMSVPTKVGEGLWKTVIARVPGGSFLVDVPQQTVFFLGALSGQRGAPTSGPPPQASTCPAAPPRGAANAAPPQTGPQYYLASLRLKVVNGKITEIELLNPEQRNADIAEATAAPQHWWNEPIPPAKRMSRAELIATANTYFEAIAAGDGSLMHITKDAWRFENGAQVTSLKTAANGPGPGTTMNIPDQVSAKVFDYIKAVNYRRWWVDEEIGAAMAIAEFDEPANPGNPAATPPVRCRNANISLHSENFKIENGQIVHVQAMGKFLPYGTPTGW